MTVVPTATWWFGHYASPGATTAFDAWGVGDSGGGSSVIDTVPYNGARPWYGLRVNCEAPTGTTRTNLQTFLVVQGPIGTGLTGGGARQIELPKLDSSKAGVARRQVQEYMKSARLQKALELHRARKKARLDALDKLKKGGK